MDEIHVRGFLDELKRSAPDFTSFYERMSNARGKNPDLFRYLALFMIGELIHIEESSSQERLDGLEVEFRKIMRLIEKTISAEDESAKNRIRESFIKTLYLASMYRDEFHAMAGPITRSMMEDIDEQNPKWIQLSREWDTLEGGDV